METIILMGPIGVGKTTQAQLLSKALSMPVCTYDHVKFEYRRKIGLDEKQAMAIEESQGLYAMLCYMNEFKAKTLVSIVADFYGHIIDLGGGAQCFDEPHQVSLAKQAFANVGNVILLMPSPGIAKSQDYLSHVKEKYPINDYLIEHDTNEMLAKKIVYTMGKEPRETTLEILDLIATSNSLS